MTPTATYIAEENCPASKDTTEAKVDRRIKHGKYKSPEYIAWAHMIDRCRNPKNKSYPEYGGRGIGFCSEWQSFERFYEDMGDRPSAKHSLDRKDNDKGYYKENCRWATPAQQIRNRGNTCLVEYRKQMMPVAELAELLGLTHKFLVTRLSRGWTIEEAIAHPPFAKLSVIRKAEYSEAAKNRAANLREMRRRLGLELREVQRDTGIPNAYISRLELCKFKVPCVKRIETLEAYYLKKKS